MSKVIPHVIDSCGACFLKSTKPLHIGFYCRVTGEWIKKLSRINADCPYDDLKEEDEVFL